MVKVRGRKRTVTRNIKQVRPASLQIPTEFVAQNGASLKRVTAVSVTGYAKSKPAAAATAKKKAAKKKHRTRERRRRPRA